jgi:predicted transcriptional regulator
MSSITVRIDRESYASLQELAVSAGETMQAILERAIKDYQAKRFWEEMDSAYRALRAVSVIEVR